MQRYKVQIEVERGFRFPKDPCLLSSVYLKKEGRIMVWVMILTLLVYSISEKKLREALKEQGESVQ